MRIAITGVSGFLGSVVANYLVERGHQVIAHENKTSINASLRRKVYEVIKGDLSKPDIQTKFLSNVDVLCHVAAYIPSNIRNLEDREKCFITNTVLTQDLALKCKEIGVAKFIFFSTANFYAPDGAKGATEKDSVNIGLAGCLPYFLSKYAAEISIESILQKKNYVILRVATPFGHGEPLSKVVPHFITCAKKNLPIRILGTGDENINLVYSKDIAKAVNLSIVNDRSGVFNICSSSIKISDLAQKCLLASGSRKGEIVTLNSPNIFSFSKINNERAKVELNWHPVDLNIALKRYSALLMAS